MKTEKFIGIDVAKETFDTNIYGSKEVKHWQYNDKQIKKFVKELVKLSPEMIVLEATGGYETKLVMAILDAELPVGVVNPRRVRSFAQAIGKLAKTDKIDAVVIAEFAAKIPQKKVAKMTESMLKVKSMVARRRQLIAMRTSEICRLDHAFDKLITRSINKTLKLFNEQIETIEQEIKTVIESDPEMNAKAKIIKSVPGFSDGTAAVLVSELPELGTLNSKQIAALVGVAPIARESGKFKGKRITGGGRASVRTQLYMPTLTAIQHNEHIREFYQSLLSNGKAKMVALVACMRKMITIVNYMVARNEYWKF